MTPAEIEARLIALDTAERPVVERFDAPVPLRGRVAVLPSAFNPPTAAHLALLEAGRAVGAGTSAAMLSTRNVAKGLDGASLLQRVEMLLAIAEARGGPAVLAVNAARIADQGEALRRHFPDAAFDFVVGFDTLVRLFDPRYYTGMARELATFFAHHRVIAANRGEHSASHVQEYLRQPAVKPFAGRVVICEVDADHAAMSSTEARVAAATQAATEAAHPALPPEVARYIRAHRLYRNESST